jgi:hypothetical protein
LQERQVGCDFTLDSRQPTNVKREIGKSTSFSKIASQDQKQKNVQTKPTSNQNIRTMSVTVHVRLVPKQPSSAAGSGSTSMSVGLCRNKILDSKQTGKETLQNIQCILEPCVRTAIAQKYPTDKQGGPTSVERKQSSPPPGVIELPAFKFNEKCRLEAGRADMIVSNKIQDYINSMKMRENNCVVNVVRCGPRGPFRPKVGPCDKIISIVPATATTGRPNTSQTNPGQPILKTAPGRPKSGINYPGMAAVIRLNNIDHLVQIKPGTSTVLAAASNRETLSQGVKEMQGQARHQGAAIRGRDKEPSVPNVTVHFVSSANNSNKDTTKGQSMKKSNDTSCEEKQVGSNRSPMLPTTKPRALLKLPGQKNQIKYQFQVFINALQNIHDFNKVNEVRKLINWRSKFELQILLMILNGLVMVTVHVITLGKLKREDTKYLPQRVFEKMIWFLKNSMELVGLFYLHDHGSDPVELQLLGAVGVEVTCIVQAECRRKYGSAPKVVHNCMVDVEKHAKVYGFKMANRVTRGILLVEKLTTFLGEFKNNTVAHNYTLEEFVKLEATVASEGQHYDVIQVDTNVQTAVNPRADLEDPLPGREVSRSSYPISTVPKTAEKTCTETCTEEITDVISCSPDKAVPVIETFSSTSMEDDFIHGSSKRRMAIKLPFKKRFRPQ